MNSGIPRFLLLYHHYIAPYAATVMEHIHAFKDRSVYNITEVNTEFGFPPVLRKIRFDGIILHYSLFGVWPPRLNNEFLDYLNVATGYKIAFFQDEYRFCQERFEFLNQYNINCVYTLFEPQYHTLIYREHTKATDIKYTIPAYVSKNLIEAAKTMRMADADRQIDVGYRAKTLPFHLGKAAQLKCEIGYLFKEIAAKTGWIMDIDVSGKNRFYGKEWNRFLANCHAVLGTEAGASIVDLDGSVRSSCEKIVEANPDLTFKEVSVLFLSKFEDNIPYLTISARHFEAAAFQTCQIMIEGSYSEIMRPMVDYISLKKDFSNIDEVIYIFNNQALRSEIIANAFDHLISSEKYKYEVFIDDFDRHLHSVGFPLPSKNVDNILTDEVGRLCFEIEGWQLLQKRIREKRTPLLERVVLSKTQRILSYLYGK